MNNTKIITTFFALFTTSLMLSAQTFNANFETDNDGWTSLQSIERTKLFAQLEDRYGLAFFGHNQNKNIPLFIQKKVENLKPNTNYRVIFNMNWLARLDVFASPIVVKVGAIQQEPTTKIIDLDNPDDDIIRYNFDQGEIGRNGRDFIVAGQLTPNENGHPFLKNIHNFNNPFFVNTDENGRLFLMIGIESENEFFTDIFLTTVRVLLRENGVAREIQDVEKNSNEEISIEKNEPLNDFFLDLIDKEIDEITTTVVFIPNAENELVFFKSDYNNDIEIVNIYTDDNHLMIFFSFRNPSVDRAFSTKGLSAGTYRIEFVLSDGRVINEKYTIK
jgi:hypothetical protein